MRILATKAEKAHLSEWIRSNKKRLNLTVNELAELTGINWGQVQAWTSGSAYPSKPSEFIPIFEKVFDSTYVPLTWDEIEAARNSEEDSELSVGHMLKRLTDEGFNVTLNSGGLSNDQMIKILNSRGYAVTLTPL